VAGRATILFSLIIFSVTIGYAQQLSHQVLLSSAGVSYIGGISYSQTIGEAAVELFSTPDYVLTQGFQQPRLTLLPGTAPPGTGVKAYPSPASHIVNIELFGETGRFFRITLTNLSGNMVYSTDIGFDSKYWYIQEIPVASLSNGLYFVFITSTDGVIRRSFKIEKM
jgi:hypothetical protein